MNDEQAKALKNLIEAGSPDTGTTVTPQPGGVHVTMSGPMASPGLSGPGGMNAELRLADDSPWLSYFLAFAVAEADESVPN